jgi:uncharacterized protein (DUF1778 family)
MVDLYKIYCIYIVRTLAYSFSKFRSLAMQTIQAILEVKISPLNIRIRADQRRLIEQAAQALDKTVSDFVREAALREANQTLLDQVLFQLSADAWQRFNEALNQPPVSNPRLQDLLQRKPIWAA